MEAPGQAEPINKPGLIYLPRAAILVGTVGEKEYDWFILSPCMVLVGCRLDMNFREKQTFEGCVLAPGVAFSGVPGHGGHAGRKV